MCFVHHYQAYIKSLQVLTEGLCAEALGRHIQQAQYAQTGAVVYEACFARSLSRIQCPGAYVAIFEGVHLVLHQRNQGRHHHGKTFQNHCRHLECQRFSATGGHQPQSVVPLHHRGDDVELARTEAVVAPVSVQDFVCPG